MSPSFYQFIHVFSAILLAGSVLAIAAHPVKSAKRRMMTLTGILSLLVLIGGFGLVAKLYGNDFSMGWLWIKILCWLGLSALAGVAYRISKSASIGAAAVLVGLAVFMVYFKPF